MVDGVDIPECRDVAGVMAEVVELVGTIPNVQFGEGEGVKVGLELEEVEPYESGGVEDAEM